MVWPILGKPRTLRFVAKQKREPSKDLLRLQAEIGRRIDEAWQRAGYSSRSDLIRALTRAGGIGDQNQVHVWARGGAMPRVDALIAIADATGVSLDWLCRGAEETPAAYVEWLESPDGQAASPDARRFLRSLPTKGYRATVAFYELAHAAWRHGLHEELDPAEMVASARAHERHARKTSGSNGKS